MKSLGTFYKALWNKGGFESHFVRKFLPLEESIYTNWQQHQKQEKEKKSEQWKGPHMVVYSEAGLIIAQFPVVPGMRLEVSQQ